jgi:peptide/nickel transport system substrate-binding protein
MDEGYEGIETPIAAANVLQINSGVTVTCNGGQPDTLCMGQADGTKVQVDTPGVDPIVRRAIAAAIDTEVVNDRAYNGAGIASSALIPPGFPWDPEVDGPKYDPDLAKRLVGEAKAKGWDGKIRLLVQNAGAPVPTGDAVETMLRAVGIEVEKDATKDTPQVIRQVFVNSDYDTVTWGYAMTPDDLLYLNLTQNLSGRYGYRSDAMTAALEELRTAASVDEKIEALEKVSQIWTDDVPAVALTHFGSYIAWDSSVRDVRATSGVTALYDKAWISR